MQASGTKATNMRIMGLDDAAGDLRPALSMVATWLSAHDRIHMSINP